MIVNVKHRKQKILQLSLINSKMSYLMKKIIRHKIKSIKSKKHKLETYEIDKISLSCFDNKRYVLDDRICTLAYFHKNSVTSCKEIEKDSDKKDCDN